MTTGPYQFGADRIWTYRPKGQEISFTSGLLTAAGSAGARANLSEVESWQESLNRRFTTFGGVLETAAMPFGMNLLSRKAVPFIIADRMVEGVLAPRRLQLRTSLALAEASQGSLGKSYLLLATNATEDALRASGNFFRSAYSPADAPARLVVLGRLRGSGENWMRLVTTADRGPVLARLAPHQREVRTEVDGSIQPAAGLADVVHALVRPDRFRSFRR